jgi:hypothetical protein
MRCRDLNPLLLGAGAKGIPGSRSLLLRAGLACALAFAAARPAAGQRYGTYPFACRGPQTVTLHQEADSVDGLDHRLVTVRLEIRLAVSPNSTGAGAHAESLSPGRCAWLDRPLGQEEPRAYTIGFEFYYDYDGMQGLTSSPVIDGLLACAATAACVFVLPARSQPTMPSGVDTHTPGPSQLFAWGNAVWSGAHVDITLLHLDALDPPDLTGLTAVPSVRVRVAP